MILQPERVPFNGSVLGSAKGTWVISVNAAVYVEGTDSLLLNVTLEKGARSTEEQGITRRLGMLVPALGATRVLPARRDRLRFPGPDKRSVALRIPLFPDEVLSQQPMNYRALRAASTAAASSSSG